MVNNITITDPDDGVVGEALYRPAKGATGARGPVGATGPARDPIPVVATVHRDADGRIDSVTVGLSDASQRTLLVIRDPAHRFLKLDD